MKGIKLPRAGRLLWTIPIVIIAGFFSFSSSAICPECGLIEHMYAMQLPLVNVSYYGRHTYERTPVGDALTKAGLVPAGHIHRWQFTHGGGGNGVMCAIGPGRHLLSSYMSNNVATFFAAIARFDTPAERDKWLARLRNPEQSRLVFSIADDPPQMTLIADSSAYRAYRQAHMTYDLFDDSSTGK